MSLHPSETLFAALGKERASYQTFGDTDKSLAPQILHGPFASVRPRLERLNEEGHGIFVMVNHGDGRGRRAENVTGVAAYFVDLDGAPLPEGLPLFPTAAVESSPKRYHLYWRVTDAPLVEFSHVQKHLAVLLGGDEAVHDLPRVLRLPGFMHRKAEPFRSRLVRAMPERVYTHADFVHRFAVPPMPAPPPPRPPLPAATQAYVDRYRRGGRPQPQRDAGSAAERVAAAPEGQRNLTLYRMGSALANQVKSGEVDRATAERELELAGLAAGLNPNEVQATIRSAMRYAQ